MMRRFDLDLNPLINSDLLNRLNSATELIGQSSDLFDKNAFLKQILSNTNSKKKSKPLTSQSAPTTIGYVLILLSAVFLIIGWMGSWINGIVDNGSATTSSPTTTTTFPTTTFTTTSTNPPKPQKWKYNCPLGYQGRLCDRKFFFSIFF